MFPQYTQGFTWIETLIVLMIFAIIASFSFPSLRDQWLLSQDRTLILQLQSAIEFAQHQAIINHAPIGICPTENGIDCTKTWNKELLIFEANHSNSKPAVIKHIYLTMHDQLRWRSYPRYRLYLLMSSQPLKQNDNGTLWHCHNQEIKWAMTFNQMGLLRIVYPEADGAFPEIPGKPLHC